MTISRREAMGWLAASASLWASRSAWAQQYDQGASDSVIKIGMPAPYSGPASSYGIIGKINEAYFKMRNDQGGINGRKVEFVTYDDQYNPARSTEVVRRMVEQDGVLAVYGNLGSAANAAVMRYMNMRKVPHIFLAVGAERFAEPEKSPWTMPFMPSYQDEGRTYAQHILKTHPSAKIAVLYQNDDFGKDLLQGLRDGLGDKAKDLLVATASFEVSDPTVDSQIISLHASGADVFVNFATARFAAQAIRKIWDIGWRPQQQYLTYVSAYVKMTLEPAGLEKSNGILAIAFFKDAIQQRWAGDAETQRFLAFMQQYAPNEDIHNSSAVYGYCVSQTMAHVLEQCGDVLTRDNVIKQAASLQNYRPEMLLPGIALNTSATNYWPIQSLQMVQFNGVEFEPVGDTVQLGA
ncbi:branched-chain amino acid ABC transporter substrate-binding protein [Lampropedia aestuarii]|uniref:Branched-chain amino acid ABC transporter substrate-binding protein n=1 Tax=Lampropedia aestuarii TaxID=2562762 RepID=A0A4S5BR37_9BURK|nr:ABC transporter substrate-binding protein [Lampropedia aestuarii]MDH5859047.1 ABC transporter substrate-binding protein [Lampropedia aestuarii]THJ32156.1 branched-chain amino acid ABC transporter substrate-binding protein [Lampropedia aestuarii]